MIHILFFQRGTAYKIIEGLSFLVIIFSQLDERNNKLTVNLQNFTVAEMSKQVVSNT
jgi:hypothetical protein